MGRIVIVGAHLDDAAFSCAGLMLTEPAEYVVVSVCAGMPRDSVQAFDLSAGYPSSRAHVAARVGVR